MDLSWLADFIALTESRSFSRAADRRHVTQPAFSRRIRALEQWAGAVLFERGPGAVTLTEPGKRFLPWAETLRRQVHEARADVRAGSQAAKAPLRIAATHSLSLFFFTGWIEAIGERISLGPTELASESLTGCERLLVEGQTQFLLAHSRPETPVRLDPSHFRSVSVGVDALVPVASPRLIAATGPDGRPTGLPVVTYSPESGLGRILRRELASDPEIADALKPAFTSHHAGVLKNMVVSAQGVAWLPRSIIGSELAGGTLVILGGARRPIALDIRLFRPETRLAADAEFFWAAAVEEAAGRPAQMVDTSVGREGATTPPSPSDLFRGRSI